MFFAKWIQKPHPTLNMIMCQRNQTPLSGKTVILMMSLMIPFEKAGEECDPIEMSKTSFKTKSLKITLRKQIQM